MAAVTGTMIVALRRETISDVHSTTNPSSTTTGASSFSGSAALTRPAPKNSRQIGSASTPKTTAAGMSAASASLIEREKIAWIDGVESSLRYVYMAAKAPASE